MSSTCVADPTGPTIFGDPRLRTDGDVLALCFAPDGSLWSVEESGLLRQWDGQGGQRRCHVLSPWEEMLWVFHPQVHLLASGGEDLSLWDPQSGRLLIAWPQPSWITALAFAPQADLLATGHDDGRLRLWDLHRLRLCCEQQLSSLPISALAFRLDGQCLACAGEDRRILLWDVPRCQVCGCLEGHTDRIPALLWHPDGQQLISAGWDTTARIWDVVTQQPLILLNTHAPQVLALALSADGRLLASADSEQQIHIWEMASRREIHVLREHEVEVHHLAFSPDGSRLAAAGMGHVIHLWDPQRGHSLTAGRTWGRAPVALALSPDGRRLVTNGGGLALQVWDTVQPRLLFSLPEEQVTSALAWSGQGKWILGGTERGIRRWHADTGAVQDLLVGPEEEVTVLAATPQQDLVASASVQGVDVWLWGMQEGQPVLLIPDAVQGCGVTSLAFAPSGRLLAVGGMDWLATGGSSGGIALWDLVERAEIATFPGGVLQLAWDPRGEYLAAVTLDGGVCLYDVTRQELVSEWVEPEDTFQAVAFHPGGRLLAAGGEGMSLYLWDWEQKRLRGRLLLTSQVKVLCFAPEGQYLYVGQGNATCSRWELSQLLNG